MLSELESFKAGFLTRCVENGIDTDEALSHIKAASDRLDAAEKQPASEKQAGRYEVVEGGQSAKITPEEAEEIKGQLPSAWGAALKGGLGSAAISGGGTALLNRNIGPTTGIAALAGGGLGALLSGLAQRADNADVEDALTRALVSRGGEKAGFLKQAGPVTELIKTLGGLAKKVVDIGAAGAVLAPPVIGGAAGYGISKLTDVDEEDVEDVKKQELIDEYKRQADKLRQSKALRSYRDSRTSRGGVYL